MNDLKHVVRGRRKADRPEKVLLVIIGILLCVVAYFAIHAAIAYLVLR